MIVYLLPQLRRRLAQRGTLLWLIELLLILLVVYAVFVVALRFFEGVTWLEAVWQSWQTVTTVGYGDLPIKTVGGRLTTICFGMACIALLGQVIAMAFECSQETKEKRRLGMADNRFKDGYVVFNFPGLNKFQDLSEQMWSVEPQVGICVVDDSLEALPPFLAILPEVCFVRGSLLEPETYERAHLNDSKAVIVFPRNPEDPQADAGTKTIVTQVLECVSESVRVMHVLVHSGHAWMFRNLRSTQILGSMEILAVVQECQGEFTSRAITSLLLNTDGPDPVTVRPVKTVGWEWSDLLVALAHHNRIRGSRVALLAIVSSGVPDTCPPADHKIEVEDSILVAVPHDSRFDWTQFEQELERVTR